MVTRSSDNLMLFALKCIMVEDTYRVLEFDHRIISLTNAEEKQGSNCLLIYLTQKYFDLFIELDQAHACFSTGGISKQFK